MVSSQESGHVPSTLAARSQPQRPSTRRAPLRVAQLAPLTAQTISTATASLAGEVAVFGPKDYVRGTGRPVIVTDTFPVANPTGSFTLHIDNGGAQGQYGRVSSAVVTLNGVVVVAPNEFNQQISVIEKPVVLISQNILSVEVRSAPGSGFTLEIFGEVDNRPPVSDAGPDQTAQVQQTVQLDGSRSHDPDGDALTFHWELRARPAGSQATLSDASAVKPMFVVDKTGAYEVQLIVNDGAVDSPPDSVRVTTTNSVPVANAGPDQTVPVGTAVQLDGSRSSDVDGDQLTYLWTIVARPPGSGASLSDPAAIKPTFVVDVAGPYDLQLVVNDGRGNSAPDHVIITTLNSAPVADAGRDQSVAVGVLVMLDGSCSSDVDGDVLTYRWSFSARPPGSNATLSDPTAVKPTFEVDESGTYVLQLIVHDGSLDSAADLVNIVTENSLPVANAGPDQTARVGDTVQLNGSGSSDVDGDALTYRWSFSAVPPGSQAVLSDPAAVQPTFTIDESGTYVAQLIVHDGSLESVADTVQITTLNSPPLANAGPDQTARVGQLVQLDGRASSDADDDPLTFQWSFTAVPMGSTATLSDPGSDQPTFVVDLHGTYVIQLIVHDGTVPSAPDRVVISTENSQPVADAGPDQTVDVDDTVTLDGSASSDADHDTLLYRWAMLSRPTGSSASLSNAAVTHPTFVADVAGLYVVQLIVNDGIEDSTPDTVSITATAPQVTVPNVVGLTQAAAQSAILAAQLTVGTITPTPSPTVPAGQVISQTPVGGTQVAKGSAVNLVVSTGSGGVTVPSVVGLSRSAAQAAILGAQLTIGVVSTAASDSVPSGNVVGQTPAGGASAPKGTAVSLVVSTGPGSISVPNVVGLAQAAAQAAIVAAQLTVGAVTTAPHATVPAGQVISQTPTGGASVSKGSAVSLVASSGSAVTLASILVTPANPLILVGQTLTFTATGIFSNGTGQNLTGQVAWASSNPGVASITGAGAATGVGTGQTTISASLQGVTGATTLAVQSTVSDPTLPTAAITTPVNNSTLTERVNIVGTATDTNFLKYVLEFAPAGESTFITLITGTSQVTNGVLGTFDPTLLLNDLYTIRLSVVDRGGNTTPTSVVYQVARDQKVGNFTLTFQDLSLPLAGLPITVNRVYDSRDKRSGDFGVGWRLDVQTMTVRANREPGSAWRVDRSGGPFPTYTLVATDAHTLSLTLPDGKVEEFDFTPTPTSSRLVPLEFLTPGYTPRPGTRGTLTPVGNPSLIIEGAQPGSVDLLDVDDVSIYDPHTFVYTALDGTTFVVDKTARVQSAHDRNGNTLTFGPGGIVHSSGQHITFVRDAQGRITQLKDPNGHTQVYTYDANGDLASHTDAEGNTTHFLYNFSHGLLEIRDPRGLRPIRNEYDDNGRLISHTDGFGNVITYAHNLDTRQEVITDRLGHITVHEYDQAGNVVRTTDAQGGVTARTYDGRGNMVSETNALGFTRSYTYDTKDNRLSEADPLGHTTSYTYNAQGQVLTITDPLGCVTSNTYDANGNLLSTRDPLGQLTTYTYDGNGNRLSQTTTRTTSSGLDMLVTTYAYDGLNRLVQTTHPDASTTQTAYNEIGQRSATIDQLGRQTDYAYDAMGRLVRTTYPDGTAATSTYDPEGRRVSGSDRAGRLTTLGYDVLGRLLQTTYADGAMTTTAYDAVGQVLATTDARGNTTRYAYDSAGRRARVTDALDHVTLFAYDAAGNQLTMTDANGHTTSYQYDCNQRRTRVTYPDSTFEITDYNALGRVIRKFDQAGIPTRFEYDALARLVRVMDALNQVTNYAYDEVGSQLSQTYANGHMTTFAYDRLGRRIRRTLPLGMFETFAYDDAGNQIAKKDFNGRTTTYTHDAMNRLHSKTPDPGLGEPTVSFSYTLTGQRASMVDASGTTTYTYDPRDRLLSKGTPQGTLTYVYDLQGNLTSIRSSNVNGVAVDYAYDALNRLATVTDNRLTPGVTTYSYDAVGNLASYVYPNGVEHAYTYNSLNRLTELTLQGTSPLARYTYALGPVGNRTAVAELSGRTVNYAYDEMYRLTNEAISSDPNGNNGSIGYTYDPVGNRRTRTSTVAAISNQTFTYDTNDRLTSDAYDANGNTIDSGGTAYAYDFENHLTGQIGGAVTMVYNGDGNRVSEMAGGVITQYLIDDRNPTGYVQVQEEILGETVQRVYTYGRDLISQSQLIGGTQTVSFYSYDGHSSVRFLTDKTGVITDRYDYDAFGNFLRSLGATPNIYFYTGEQFDPNIGFYYLRARFLDMNKGRFVSFDPHAGSIFDPRSLHKYVYVNGDPINKFDPSGRTTLTEQIQVNVIVSILSRILVESFKTFVLQKKAPTTGEFLTKLGIDITTGVVGAAGGAIASRSVGFLAEKFFNRSLTFFGELSLSGATEAFIKDFIVNIIDQVANKKQVQLFPSPLKTILVTFSGFTLSGIAADVQIRTIQGSIGYTTRSSYVIWTFEQFIPVKSFAKETFFSDILQEAVEKAVESVIE